MAISIGQLNSYLKKYTDALLTLHGIPTTDYTHEVSSENMMAEFTARKTLETAMWNLCQHAEAQAEEIAKYKTIHSKEPMKSDCWFRLRNIEAERQLHDARADALATDKENQKLVEAVKKLHHHIITPSKTAEQSAERYEAIVEFAEETLAPYGGAEKREWFDPSDDEQTDDEQTDEE